MMKPFGFIEGPTAHGSRSDIPARLRIVSLPLIKPDQDFALWAVLFGLAAFGFWSERYAWGRKYSGILLLMTAAIILANLKIIPTRAPAYDAAWQYLVPVAIPLLLF